MDRRLRSWYAPPANPQPFETQVRQVSQHVLNVENRWFRGRLGAVQRVGLAFGAALHIPSAAAPERPNEHFRDLARRREEADVFQ